MNVHYVCLRTLFGTSLTKCVSIQILEDFKDNIQVTLVLSYGQILYSLKVEETT